MNIILDCTNPETDWVATGTLLVTLITAVATLLTVKEIKKQRETSYFPDLYLGNQSVYVYGIKWNNSFLPFDYSPEPIESEKDDTKRHITVEIHNVGFAVSKAIEYEWKYDIKGVIEQINKVNRVGYFHIHYEHGLEISVPQTHYKNYSMVENQLRKRNINYILPSSIQKNPAQISVPKSYIDLYNVFLSCAFNHHEIKTEDQKGIKTYNIDFKNFPPLIISMSYKDLNAKTHVKTFNLHFDFVTMSSPEGMTEERREFGRHVLVATEINPQK